MSQAKVDKYKEYKKNRKEILAKEKKKKKIEKVVGWVALVVLAVATAVAGIGAAAVLDVRAGYYECPDCGALFVPSLRDYVKGYHTLTRRRLQCPVCGKTGMCRRRVVRK